MGVTGDEDSIHPEHEHDGINYDNQEAPDSPAAADATSSDVSPGTIIDPPIKFNKADVKNVLACRVPGCPDNNPTFQSASDLGEHLVVSHNQGDASGARCHWHGCQRPNTPRSIPHLRCEYKHYFFFPGGGFEVGG